MALIINPLFNNNTIEDDEINNVFIFIYTGNSDIDSSIYKLNIKKDIFDNISKNLIIYKTNKNILLNNFHKTNIIILSDIILQPYNIFNYNLDNKNIVLPIYNISFDNIILYINQYETNETFDNIYKLLTLNKYFNTENCYYKVNYINNKLSRFIESNYWENKMYCIANLTQYFKERKFNIYYLKNTNNNNVDYLLDINKNNNYIDPSKLNLNFKCSYKCNYTKEEINIIYDNLDKKQKYLLICNLLISKKYCHLVLNNYE